MMVRQFIADNLNDNPTWTIFSDWDSDKEVYLTSETYTDARDIPEKYMKSFMSNWMWFDGSFDIYLCSNYYFIL